MMSKTGLVLLLVCAVALQDSHAWLSRRRTVRAAVNAAGKVALKAAVSWLGKREVVDDDVSQHLEETCPGLLELVESGSDQDLLQGLMSQSDADGDGSLSGNEMETFTQFLEAIEICQEFDAQTDGGQP